MQILKIEDPRDSLSRARRSELYKFAVENGVTEISQHMPADMMRRILRVKQLTHIRTSAQQLGALPKTPTRKVSPDIRSPVKEVRSNEGKGVEIGADDDLERQWRAQLEADNVHPVSPASVAIVKPRPFRNPDRPTMAEVKRECKKHGIKAPPTAKMSELLEQLNGKDAS